eukprot:ANDGO_00869.mRNA.1 hypothetical protein
MSQLSRISWPSLSDSAFMNMVDSKLVSESELSAMFSQSSLSDEMIACGRELSQPLSQTWVLADCGQNTPNRLGYDKSDILNEDGFSGLDIPGVCSLEVPSLSSTPCGMTVPSSDSHHGRDDDDIGGAGGGVIEDEERKTGLGEAIEDASCHSGTSTMSSHASALSIPWFGVPFQLLPSCSVVVLWKHGTAMHSPWIGDVHSDVLKTMTNRVGIRFSGILPMCISCRLILLDDGSQSGFNKMVPKSRKTGVAPFELCFPAGDFSGKSEVFPFEPFIIPKPTVGVGLNLRFVVIVQDNLTGRQLNIVSSSCFQVRGRQPSTPEENERRRLRNATRRLGEEELSMQ